MNVCFYLLCVEKTRWKYSSTWGRSDTSSQHVTLTLTNTELLPSSSWCFFSPHSSSPPSLPPSLPSSHPPITSLWMQSQLCIHPARCLAVELLLGLGRTITPVWLLGWVSWPVSRRVSKWVSSVLALWCFTASVLVDDKGIELSGRYLYSAAHSGLLKVNVGVVQLYTAAGGGACSNLRRRVNELWIILRYLTCGGYFLSIFNLSFIVFPQP